MSRILIFLSLLLAVSASAAENCDPGTFAKLVDKVAQPNRRSVVGGILALMGKSVAQANPLLEAIGKIPLSQPEKRISFWRRIYSQRKRMLDGLQARGSLDQLLPGFGGLDAGAQKRVKLQLAKRWLAEDVLHDFTDVDLTNMQLKRLIEVAKKFPIGAGSATAETAQSASRASKQGSLRATASAAAPEAKPVNYVLEQHKQDWRDEFLDQRTIPQRELSAEEKAARQQELEAVFKLQEAGPSRRQLFDRFRGQ